MHTKTKAQTISEFVVLLSVVSLAAMTMSLYFRRGIQALVKVAVDEVGNQSEAFDTDYRTGKAIWKLQSLESQSASSGSENTAKQSGGGERHEKEQSSNGTYKDNLLSGELWYDKE
jgi:hypothetical protein